MNQSKFLKSWKEIASYLGIGVRTAQRWKADRGLPVKQPGTRRSAVLAVSAEIDQWLIESSRPPPNPEGDQPLLSDVDITYALWQRHSRPRHADREVEALLELGRAIARQEKQAVLSKISTHALMLCKAESAGFSILQTDPEKGEIFLWTATCGRMQEFEGGWTPANFSPCGVCLERNSPQLFRYPEKIYAYLQPISPISELLLIPMHEGNSWVGTLWVICHEKRRKFDREDVQLVTHLGSLAAALLLSGEKERDRTTRPEGQLQGLTGVR